MNYVWENFECDIVWIVCDFKVFKLECWICFI